MNWAPRLSLRTLFLLIFCAAVGLAIYPTSIAALEPAVAVAMVIGLIQQARQLCGWHLSANEATNELVFARQFAIAWRVLVAAIISTWIIIGMLASQGMLQLPDHEDVWFDLQYDAVLPLCLVVVMCSSLARWQSASPFRTKRGWRVGGLWAFGILIGIFLLIDGTGVLFLVHKGVANIEAAQVYRRSGIYPNLADEGYRSVWAASAAVVSLITAGAVLVWSSNVRNDWRKLATAYALFPLLLVPPALFCYPYYTDEFHRLSPEIAGAGLAANWEDWLIGAILAGAFAVTCAYQLTVDRQRQAVIAVDLSHNIERTAFHESFFCLCLIAVHAFYSIALHVASIISDSLIPRRLPPGWRDLMTLCGPMSLLAIALLLVTGQLCLVRWRNRSYAVAWKLNGLLRPAFVLNGVALTLLLFVGVPTLNAFAFLLWLGPWNLPWQLFGL